MPRDKTNGILDNMVHRISMESIKDYLAKTAKHHDTLTEILDLCYEASKKGISFVQVNIPEDKVTETINYLVEIAKLTVEPIQSTNTFEISGWL